MPIAKRKAKLYPALHGVKYVKNALAVSQTQVQKAINCHLDENGELYTRMGSTLYNTTALNGAIRGIYEWRRPDGSSTTSTLIVVAGTKWYKWNTSTSTFDEIGDLNGTGRPTFASFTDSSDTSYVILANGTDFYKYDNTTVTVCASSYPWSSTAPRYIWVYDDRLMAAGLDEEPYRVYVSDILDCTDWLGGAGATAQYWTLKSARGNRITGLHSVSDFGAIFQEFGVTIITEGNPDSSSSKQIEVSTEYGTTSHWSVQTVGNMIYFCDRSHIYEGRLREAVINGLQVRTIDTNILEKYREIVNHTDIVSVYDARHKEIQWAGRTRNAGRNNISLIYNLALSKVDSEYGQLDVWAGWFKGDGYEPYTLHSGIYSETVYTITGQQYNKEKKVIFRGDEDGYVYRMEDDYQFKDELRVSGATVDQDIETEIVTGAISPFGNLVYKNARMFYPEIFQLTDNSTYVQWIIDGTHLLPATNRTLKVYGLSPRWRASGDTDRTSLWGSIVWADRPTEIIPVHVEHGFHYIQFKIINAGSNTYDKIGYFGGELWYQPRGLRRSAG